MVRPIRSSSSVKPRLPSSAASAARSATPACSGSCSGAMGKIVGEMMREDVDQRAFELLRVGMAELGSREFLEMIVQQPRVIDRRQAGSALRGAGSRRDGRDATGSPQAAGLPRHRSRLGPIADAAARACATPAPRRALPLAFFGQSRVGRLKADPLAETDFWPKPPRRDETLSGAKSWRSRSEKSCR